MEERKVRLHGQTAHYKTYRHDNMPIYGCMRAYLNPMMGYIRHVVHLTLC